MLGAGEGRLKQHTTTCTTSWHATHFPVEVGSRGWVAHSLLACLQKLGFSASWRKKVRRECSRVALRCSYLLYLRRSIKTWNSFQRAFTWSKRCQRESWHFLASADPHGSCESHLTLVRTPIGQTVFLSLISLFTLSLICVASESTRDHSGRILATCSYIAVRYFVTCSQMSCSSQLESENKIKIV